MRVRAKKVEKVSKRAESKDADTRSLEADLSAHLGMAVQIDMTSGEAGVLTVRYKTLDDLDRLCQAMSSVPAEMG